MGLERDPSLKRLVRSKSRSLVDLSRSLRTSEGHDVFEHIHEGELAEKIAVC